MPTTHEPIRFRAGTLRVRDAREGDIPELARIYAASVEALAPPHYDPTATRAWASFAATPGFRRFILEPRTLVAEDESGLLGFTGIEPSGRITALYVRPDRAGAGLGSLLLQTVLELGEAGSIRVFRAEASELSRRLFERFGFTLVEKETVWRDGAEIDRFRMVRG